jgi:hypothetical protein
MVDSLPPSGTDPDNQTIITNSKGKLSVPLDRGTLDVGPSGEVKVFDSTQYYLASFNQDSGDWTGIDRFQDGGFAKVVVPEGETKSASVTADLTDIDKLDFRIDVWNLGLKIEFDGIEQFSTGDTNVPVTVEISDIDDYGANTTVTFIGHLPYDSSDYDKGKFYIDYIRSKITQSEPRIVELVDTGGL